MDPREGAEPPPENKDPETLVNAYSIGVEFLQSYGWFLLLGVAILFYLRQKFSPTLEEWQRKKEEQSAYAFDASVASRRAEAMEASRQRMQAKLDAEAEKFVEKQQQREEEKRKAKIQDWDNHQQGKGYRSKVKAPEEASGSNGPKPRKTNTYRTNDYNPLMGGGGGGGYTPPRRGGRGGG